jgi:hypothetical protein
MAWSAADDQSVDEMTRPGRRILVSPRAVERIAIAQAALEALADGSPALVLAPTQEAADELVRAVAVKRGALFAVDRLMLNRLLGLLAAEYAAENRLAFLSRLGAQAIREWSSLVASTRCPGSPRRWLRLIRH